jgi:hypothetical protein
MSIDYTAIRDSQFKLTMGVDPDNTDTFQLPADVDPGAPSILALMVDTDKADKLQLNIDLNGKKLTLTAQYYGDVYHTINEVVEPNVLLVGSNTITFTLKAGTGSLRYSDVVLWWRHGKG